MNGQNNKMVCSFNSNGWLKNHSNNINIFLQSNNKDYSIN